MHNAELGQAQCLGDQGTQATCEGIRDQIYGDCVYDGCCWFWERWSGACDDVPWPY